MNSGEESIAKYLRSGYFIDSDHPGVIEFSRKIAGEADFTAARNSPAEKGGAPEVAHPDNDRERAIALYLAIRDGFRYDPYQIDLSPKAMKASSLLGREYGFCIPKALLLAAAARVQGIPARIGFVDVRNHLTTERFRRSMGTDEFVYHGYADLLIEGKWVKATPAFNSALCERFGVEPLEFDGRSDSVFQPFDRAGNLYMEYLRDRGVHSDLPLDDLREVLEKTYPTMIQEGHWEISGRFEDDAAADRVNREEK